MHPGCEVERELELPEALPLLRFLGLVCVGSRDGVGTSHVYLQPQELKSSREEAVDELRALGGKRRRLWLVLQGCVFELALESAPNALGWSKGYPDRGRCIQFSQLKAQGKAGCLWIRWPMRPSSLASHPRLAC